MGRPDKAEPVVMRPFSRHARVLRALPSVLALGAVLGLAACAGAAPVVEAADLPGAAAPLDPSNCPVLPEGFVYLNTVDPSIEVDLRYAGTENFTGEVVDGYQHANAAVLRSDAAVALAEVQADLAEEGLGLLVYDAFRPTRSVAAFVEWSHTDDDATHEEYYPAFEKPQLFELGYIAEQSSHSLGGTVDLTLVDLVSGEPLDMGGEFDLFDERSHYDFADVSGEQFENRTRLREAMIAASFDPYPQEWWHFSYAVPDKAERLDFALEPCG
jgi:D-alanyl-D-alanine dipeptidase